MRFLARSLTGLALACLTLGLIGWGVWSLSAALEAERAATAPRPPAAERVLPAEVARLEPTTFRPTLSAFGRIEPGRRLELRAARSGALTALTPAFRDGGRVSAGELLFAIDPAAAESALARARIARDEAEAEARIAAAALELARKDFEGAGARRDLQARALGRQEDLRSRGVGTDAAVESATLALSEAEQRLISREQAMITAENRAALAEISLRRARLAVADAERDLVETEVYAPFDGIVADARAVLGRRVAAEETLGALLDPEAWEAAVEAPSGAVAELAGPNGDLTALEAEVSLALGPDRRRYPAVLSRAGATSGATGAGRTLYLRLGPEAARVLRPGDFVTAEIAGPPLEGVAVAPALSLNAADEMLLIGEDDRLEVWQAEVIRRQRDVAVLAEAPFGRLYLRRRRPQFGAGVKVAPELTDPPEGGGPVAADSGAEAQAAERVALTADRRARLAALVEGAPALAPDRRAELLAELARPDISRDALDRLERLEAGDPPPPPSDG